MKKLILSLFLISLLFATPCVAQIKTERFITPNGTLWQLIGPELEGAIGFYRGHIYLCNSTSGTDCEAWPGNDFYSNFIYSKFEAQLSYYYYSITLSGYTIPLLRRGSGELCANYAGSVCETFDLRLISNFWSPY